MPKGVQVRMETGIPGGGPACNIFEHVRLGADSGFVRNPVSQPAEVYPGEILLHPGSFLRRPFPGLLLQFFGLKNIKGISAAQHVPAEMGFCSAFGKKRSGFQALENPVLRQSHIDAERRIHPFRAVKIDKLKSCIVDICNFLGNFI